MLEYSMDKPKGFVSILLRSLWSNVEHSSMFSLLHEYDEKKYLKWLISPYGILIKSILNDIFTTNKLDDLSINNLISDSWNWSSYLKKHEDSDVYVIINKTKCLFYWGIGQPNKRIYQHFGNKHSNQKADTFIQNHFWNDGDNFLIMSWKIPSNIEKRKIEEFLIKMFSPIVYNYNIYYSRNADCFYSKNILISVENDQLRELGAEIHFNFLDFFFVLSNAYDCGEKPCQSFKYLKQKPVWWLRERLETHPQIHVHPDEYLHLTKYGKI